MNYLLSIILTLVVFGILLSPVAVIILIIVKRKKIATWYRNNEIKRKERLKRYAEQKAKLAEQKAKLAEQLPEDEINININLDDIAGRRINRRFEILEIKRLVRTSLESARIVTTTNNTSTFISRYEYLRECVRNLNSSSRRNSDYKLAMQEELELHMTGFYGDIATEEEILLAFNYAKVKDDQVFGDLLYKCVDRYCYAIEEEIASLKTDAAKSRRINKLHATISSLSMHFYCDDRKKYGKLISEMVKDRFNIDVNFE